MKIYPAIDLMNGRVVRLVKGQEDTVTDYGDPLQIAHWLKEYVDHVHIVDLDGAFHGLPQHLEVVESIVKETGLQVQFGGGLRDLDSVARVVDLGVTHPVIGTRAYDPGFLAKAARRSPGLTVSLDVQQGKVSTHGWLRQEERDARSAFARLRCSVHRFIYTSIGRDGTMDGPEEIDKFWDDEEFLYAGGVCQGTDVVELAEQGFSGVIVGKALYESKGRLGHLLKVATRC